MTAVGLVRFVDELEIVSKLPTRKDVEDKVKLADGLTGLAGGTSERNSDGISSINDAPIRLAPQPVKNNTPTYRMRCFTLLFSVDLDLSSMRFFHAMFQT